MADNPDVLLEKARWLYNQGNKEKGDAVVKEILTMDFDHRKTWELLHQLYGSRRTFDDFRQEFTKRYFPHHLNQGQNYHGPITTSRVELDAKGAGQPASLLDRLIQLLKAFLKNASSTGQPKQTKIILKNKPAADVSEDTQPVRGTDPSSEPQPVHLPTDSSRRTHSQPTTPPDKVENQANLPTALPPEPEKPKIQPNGNTIQVMVVDDIAQTRENIVRSLSFHTHIQVVATAANGKEAIQVARSKHPDVVLMDVNMPDMDGLTATAGVRKVSPASQIIILTVQDDLDYMRRAMMVGARDFLTKPPMIDDLVNAVQHAYEFAIKEKAKLAAQQPVIMAAAEHSRGKIITVYSSKGGTGRTALAANLAVTLSNSDTNVVIVDGNLQFGDMAVLFNEQEKTSVLDLALRAEELDAEFVESVLVSHRSGVKLLGAPRPEEVVEVSSDQFTKMLRYLSTLFAYVIVDTSTHLSDATLAAIDASDLMIVVTLQEIPSIVSTRRFLDLVPKLKIPPQRILLVMNGFDERVNISPEKVNKTFQQEIAALIPREEQVVIPSINRGMPFMLQSDIHAKPLGKAYLSLAEAVRQRLKEIEEPELESNPV
ncbi:MAG: response regulator [Anaerolineales bacterium]|jgi:pilus assembly protein CpaE